MNFRTDLAIELAQQLQDTGSRRITRQSKKKRTAQ